MSDETANHRRSEADIVLPLMEEKASVSIRNVTTGRMRVTTHVEAFEEVARADLQSDVVEVTRHAVNQPVSGPPPQTRTDGDVTIVPVFEEVLVVEKRLMLKEELHIRRRTSVEAVAIPVALRRQTATVERFEPEPESTG